MNYQDYLDYLAAAGTGEAVMGFEEWQQAEIARLAECALFLVDHHGYSIHDALKSYALTGELRDAARVEIMRRFSTE